MITNKEIELEDLSVSALNRLFEYESDATCRGESDGTLLCRCADVLAQKEGFAEEHDKAFSAELDRVMQSVSTELPPVRKPLRLKKALLVAAAAAVLLCCASVVVAALGFDVCGYFKGLVFSPAGSKIEENGITLLHNGKTTVYSSIEELIKAEQLEIMYPTKLPDGVSITEVRMVPREDGKETVEIKTNDTNTFVCIDLTINNVGDTFADCELYSKNDKAFYIQRQDFFAISCFKENFYYIQSNSYENLITIIDNMKE
ncbi:MAG: hypothetical protein IJD82_00205 [Clostridia bacterium]|nr:hypothetical protein [Clostridia bacterium]